MFLFGLLSTLRFVIAGKSLYTSLPGLIGWFFLVVYTSSMNNERLIQIILKAFTLAMGLHLFSIFAPIDFIKNGLSAQTAYGVSRYGFNTWLARSTGFTQSPGVLAFLSVQGVFVGIAMFHAKRKKQWIVLFILSIVCGILTYNRSFYLVMVIIVFALPMFVRFNLRSLIVYISFISLLAVLVAVLSNKADFVFALWSRINIDTLEKAVYTRLYGEAGLFRVFEAIKNYPMWGSFEYDDYYNRFFIMVNEQKDYVLVHNGVLNIFATRGVVIGLLFVYLIFKSIMGYLKTEGSYMSVSKKNIMRIFFGAFLIGQVFCLFESFSEHMLMLVFMSTGLMQHKTIKPYYLYRKSTIIERQEILLEQG